MRLDSVRDGVEFSQIACRNLDRRIESGVIPKQRDEIIALAVIAAALPMSMTACWTFNGSRLFASSMTHCRGTHLDELPRACMDFGKFRGGSRQMPFPAFCLH